MLDTYTPKPSHLPFLGHVRLLGDPRSFLQPGRLPFEFRDLSLELGLETRDLREYITHIEEVSRGSKSGSKQENLPRAQPRAIDSPQGPLSRGSICPWGRGLLSPHKLPSTWPPPPHTCKRSLPPSPRSPTWRPCPVWLYPQPAGPGRGSAPAA